MPELKYIRQLQRLIRSVHDCSSRHFTTIPVTEVAASGARWQGDVEVFDLTGHPTAQTCYVWNDQRELIAMLGISPVDSAEAAVKIALAEKTRRSPSLPPDSHASL